MYYKNFDEIIYKQKNVKEPKKVAVVVAEDEHTLEAVFKVKNDGIVDPILIGNKDKISRILDKLGQSVHEDNIFSSDTPEDAAEKGVELVRSKKADFLMKGMLETSQILKAVVNKEHGLGTGNVMSHMAIQTVPKYHKLLVTTDGGMLMYPTLEQKKAIIQNAVNTLVAMGYEKPKVGVLAAVEKVNPKMPETLDAEILKQMNIDGQITDCIVEGPISFDIAICKERAVTKGYKSEVAGDADILLVPNITAGNILGKCLVEMSGAKMAGLIIGAKVPIVVTSRGSSSEEKYLSLVLAAAAVR